MEAILSQFNAENLDIKLTSEKLFIKTLASDETFALRSVNGIGVIDLVDDYNNALAGWKANKINTTIFYILGGVFVLLGLGISFFWLLFAAIFLIFGWANKTSEPKLISAVRIMMSGQNRDFTFDKTGIKSGNVAEVEKTLTAYHKNND